MVEGPTWVWPIQIFCDPTVLPEIASKRLIPEVCRVSPLTAFAGMCSSRPCQTLFPCARSGEGCSLSPCAVPVTAASDPFNLLS